LIPDQLLRLAESTINKALKTDSLAASELASLQGKTFAIECQSPPMSISLSADAEGVVLSNGICEEASVILVGTLPTLMTLASSIARDESDFSSSAVEIRGDVGALLQLSRAMSRLDIDWEDIVGSFIGEIPSRLLFLGLERIQEKKPIIKEKVLEVSANFLTGPAGLAKAGQATEVRNQLRQLQYRLDRLQARIVKVQGFENTSAENESGLKAGA
jgi:ubiquinone biosynthesis protein UbiJ|tara:strand:- start:14060 stop:14707 length:648 start_codon:yes stop_codon:yes gene_type:complete